MVDAASLWNIHAVSMSDISINDTWMVFSWSTFEPVHTAITGTLSTAFFVPGEKWTFVSHKQMSGDYNLCDVLKVEFEQKWLSSVICKMEKICNYWQKKTTAIYTNHNVAFFTIYSQEESSNEML